MTKRKSEAPEAPARPRGGEARAIAELVPEVGRLAFRRFGFVQSAIVTRWTDIVGPRYAAVSMPESIRFPPGRKAGGTLELAVTGAHAPLIQHILPEVIERVNRFFGYDAVTRVRLKQGLTIPAAPVPLPARPVNDAAAPTLGTGLRGIADQELAAVLDSFAGHLASSVGIPQMTPGEAIEKDRTE